MALIRQIERNERPFLTALKVVSPPLAFVVGIGPALGLGQSQVAYAVTVMLIGGLILAFWAQQANERWTLPAYVLRYVASCGVAVAWQLLCTG